MSDELLQTLRQRIALTRLNERPRLMREWQRLRGEWARGQDVSAALQAFTTRIDQRVARVESLQAQALFIDYDAELPISAHRQQILDALSLHQVLILSGATGSGKSTQLPKLCIEAGRGLYGLIGHTQPRRIAARALANRLAQEIKTQVGGAVGYQVRFTDHTGPNCRVKLMTDGILLRELEADRDLLRYDTLIIDEAHERSLNIDLLLGVLKTLLSRRTDLKLIVTSATIDTERFAAFFDGAPVIEVSGRSYPVEVRYRPLLDDSEDEAMELSLPEGVVAAVRELTHSPSGRGDVLVFLPGEKQIRETAKALTDAKLHHTEILPLYARLSVAEQERIFAAHDQQRVVLATNVAETSLTVPGIRYVVDSGLARISRYSVRGKVQRLPIEKISQASADQRKGRCGRTAPGICIRLYGQDDFDLRDAFTAPEIMRTNLASVILKLAMMRQPDPAQFPFVDAPEMKLINDGYRLLQELKAVDSDRQITALGRQIATLPVDPRLARMLLAAEHHHCLKEMLVIAAFLSIQDPRERPQEAQQKADQHHLTYADPRSDFMTILKLWQRFHDSAEALSGNQLRKWCREQFLSFMRCREWQEVHEQLCDAVDDLELQTNQAEANYADIHQAILTGFLGGIGQLLEQREYEGVRNSRFVIAPGTPLASKPPKWLVAASLLETTRTFARMVAAIEPPWIEAAGAHLLKFQYTEPHWQTQRGMVAAYASASLYGLTVFARRRINYAQVAPEEARQLFVRAALVEGDTDASFEFLERNQALLARVHDWESRLRRRDLLADEHAQVEFYLQRLPKDIHSIANLKKWLGLPQHAAMLTMSLRDVLHGEVADNLLQEFPDELDVAGNHLKLSYLFDPSSEQDGVTLTVPVPLVSMLNHSKLLWLIPGWHRDVVTEIIRALPKVLRKQLIPVPQYAGQALEQLRGVQDRTEAFAAWLTQRCGVKISAEELLALSLPDHLRVFMVVTDVNGKPLAQGRDLRALQREVLRRAEPQAWVASAASAAVLTAAKRWEWHELPQEKQTQQHGVHFTVYPALQDQTDGVALVELSDAGHARQVHELGVLRLLILSNLKQYQFVRQQCAAQRELQLMAQGVVTGKPIADQVAERIVRQCFLKDTQELPRTQEAFSRLQEPHRAALNEVTGKTLEQLRGLFADWREVRLATFKLTAPIFAQSIKDIQAQLQSLLPADFLTSTSTRKFSHLPRYVQALRRRVERLAGNVARDGQLRAQVEPFSMALQSLRKAHPATHDQIELLDLMIEEFRVSLFAQELKTVLPVSANRLQDQLLRTKQATR